MAGASFKRLLRRFGRDSDGAIAVEMGFIALPFFALLYAIIEVGIVFFAGQVLETAMQDSSRLIFTAQAQSSSMTAQQFKDDVCSRVSVLMSCSGIGVDVKYYPAGSTITITDPISGGAYDPSGFQYSPPAAGATGTVVVRGFYQWQLFVTGLLGFNIANLSGNKRLLAATSAFHVEPSP